MNGLKFDKFEITPNYTIRYMWAQDHVDFDEDKIKEEVKEIMSNKSPLSGHRVLLKRGPGNRGASQCGSTHEATSGLEIDEIVAQESGKRFSLKVTI